MLISFWIDVPGADPGGRAHPVRAPTLQLEKIILNDNQCDDIFQYIFTDNHHKSIEKKNAKVRVERSPIFKDRFFL
jgi:hypothetical protein